MVTEVQRKLVQSTFAAILPIADDAAMLFYQRLFEIAPELRSMFRSDMSMIRPSRCWSKGRCGIRTDGCGRCNTCAHGWFGLLAKG